MFDRSQIGEIYGSDVYDSKGDKLGKVGQVYTGAYTGEPEWVSVKTGLFGMNESLAPLHGARVEDDRLHLAHEKDTVNDAPNIDVDEDEPLSGEDVQRLYDHYSVGRGDSLTDADRGGWQGRGGDDAMTRSEERLNVDTQRQPTGTARLRKYVVTENVQQTVPVQRERATLEREPITDANRGDAYSGPDITESEHEVTLHEERPVVSKETVPVERVRLNKETVRDEQTVRGDVRREQIESDLSDPRGERR